MKKQERIILTAYLKEHIREAVIYGAIVVILLGLAGLYEYEKAIENMSYAAVLIAFFGAVYGVWDYFCYRKKCRLLIASNGCFSSCSKSRSAAMGVLI